MQICKQLQMLISYFAHIQRHHWDLECKMFSNGSNFLNSFILYWNVCEVHSKTIEVKWHFTYCTDAMVVICDFTGRILTIAMNARKPVWVSENSEIKMQLCSTFVRQLEILMIAKLSILSMISVWLGWNHFCLAHFYNSGFGLESKKEEFQNFKWEISREKSTPGRRNLETGFCHSTNAISIQILFFIRIWKVCYTTADNCGVG